jgi:glycosyltransferase involved in cell wall biosynthesis
MQVSTQLTVVLPAYREEASISYCLRRLIDSLDSASISFAAIVVVDGPGDRTAEIARAFPDSRISVLELSENKGKGFNHAQLHISDLLTQILIYIQKE